jgi:hypothetical protein
MEKIIYQKRRVGLGFNCVIELNQKMLILKIFLTKNYCLCDEFDCVSFTEGLITSLSTADGEAPASSRIFVTSVCPHFADRCRGVMC